MTCSLDLTKEDFALIGLYRQTGVFQRVDSYRLDQREGAVVVSCADADRFFDIFMNHAEMQRVHRDEPRIHWLTRNGGALRLAPQCPLNRPGRSTQADFLDEIEETLPMKRIGVIALYGHAPCGKACAHEVSIPETVSLLVAAKNAVRERFPTAQVCCFYHVDYGPDFAQLGKDKRQLTYFVDREKWEIHGEEIARQHKESLLLAKR